MNNSFIVNYMTKTCNSFLKMDEMLHKAEKNKEFNRELLEKYESMREASGDGRIDRVLVEDMTMEEYKQYIHNKISQIPMNPSRSGWMWNIEITDEAFEVMKNDPEYEKYVLNTIRNNFSAFDPWHSKRYSVLHFGATKEESYGRSWGEAESPCIKKQKDTYWEQRLEKKKRMQKQAKKYMEKRKMQELDALENAVQRKLDYERIEKMSREKEETDEIWIRQKKVAKAAKAAAFYETNIIVGNSGIN